MAKRNYDDEAKLLSQAIDIAIEAFVNHIPAGWTPGQVEHFINVYTEFKADALNPKPRYRNLQNLKYIEDAAFTYFQEGPGAAVDYFWQQIRAQALPYKRQNRMAKILKKQKISNQVEYDFVTDTMIAYLPDDMITQADALQLENYLRAYDDKMSKKNS